MADKMACVDCLQYFKEVKSIDLALQNVVRTGHSYCIQWHIEEGADVNGVDMKEHTCLILAVFPLNSMCIEPLIEAGADVNYKMSDGSTVLHKAAYYGTCESVQLLIKAGADVNATDEHQNTSLMYAAMDYEFTGKRLEILLHEGAKINIINKDHRNAVQTHMMYQASLNRGYYMRMCHVLLAAGETKSCKKPELTALLGDELIPCMKHLCRGTVREHLL